MGGLQLTLYIHLLVTWVLVGMIWFVQIVHYPLYELIKKGFHEYELMHMKRTGWLLGPLMLVELVTAIFLVGLAGFDLFSKLAALNLILIVFIWISTFLFQISEHQHLAARFSKKIHHQLLRTNWGRTIIWTLRGIIVLVMQSLLMMGY